LSSWAQVKQGKIISLLLYRLIGTALLLQIFLKAEPAPPAVHPYLFVTPEQIVEIKKNMTDSSWQWVLSEAKKLLNDTIPREWSNQENNGMKFSRSLLRHSWYLGMAYLLTGESSFSEKLKTDLWQGAERAHWADNFHSENVGSSGDLMTGEMGLAYGIAYDWIFSSLTPQDRHRLIQIMNDKCFNLYIRSIEVDKIWWAGPDTMASNWNGVVNGGMGVAALAFYHDSDLAKNSLDLSRSALQRYFNAFGEDGGWEEGPGYWGYGIYSALQFVAALQTALKTDDGVFQKQGIRHAGDFILYFHGPDKRVTNFQDAREYYEGTVLSAMLNLARHYQDPAYYWLYSQIPRRGWRRDILELLWRPDTFPAFDPATLPLIKHFRDIEWASMRSNWNDPANAVYLALRSGTTEWDPSHHHLDLNHFMLVAYGERLLPNPGYGQFETIKHNVILVNGTGQVRHWNKDWRPEGEDGKIEILEQKGEHVYMISHCGTVYPALHHFRRHILFVKRKYFVILDDIVGKTPAQIDWLLHPKGKLSLQKKEVIVKGDSVSLWINFLSPPALMLSELDSAYKGFKARLETPQEEVLFMTLLVPYREQRPELTPRLEQKPKELILTISEPAQPKNRFVFKKKRGQWRLN